MSPTRLSSCLSLSQVPLPAATNLFSWSHIATLVELPESSVWCGDLVGTDFLTPMDLAGRSDLACGRLTGLIPPCRFCLPLFVVRSHSPTAIICLPPGLVVDRLSSLIGVSVLVDLPLAVFSLVPSRLQSISWSYVEPTADRRSL